MAYPTPVNDQITDSVTQSNVEVLANSAALAVGSLMQSLSSSQAQSSQNASSNQQNVNTITEAVTTMCTEALLD